MKQDIATYKQLEQCVRAFKHGTFNVLFIIGDPGQCKSTIVRQVLGPGDRPGQPRWVRGGSITSFELYKELHTHQDRDFVLDDCDQLWTDRTSIRLLKCLCETEAVKQIAWLTHNQYMIVNNIPKEFETKSRVVIICNKWKTVSQDVEALEDRGLMVRFNPTTEEVLNQGRHWFKDEEVLSWVDDNRAFIWSLSLRALVVAAEMKAAGLDWRGALDHSLGLPRFREMYRLVGDESHVSDDSRLFAYNQAMKEYDSDWTIGRDTWFRYKKRLTENVAALEKAAPKPKKAPRRRSARSVVLAPLSRARA